MPKLDPPYNEPAFAAVAETGGQVGLTKLEYAAIHIFAARTARGIADHRWRTIADECIGDALVLFEQLQADHDNHPQVDDDA